MGKEDGLIQKLAKGRRMRPSEFLTRGERRWVEMQVVAQPHGIHRQSYRLQVQRQLVGEKVQSMQDLMGQAKASAGTPSYPFSPQRDMKRRLRKRAEAKSITSDPDAPLRTSSGTAPMANQVRNLVSKEATFDAIRENEKASTMIKKVLGTAVPADAAISKKAISPEKVWSKIVARRSKALKIPLEEGLARAGPAPFLTGETSRIKAFIQRTQGTFPKKAAEEETQILQTLGILGAVAGAAFGARALFRRFATQIRPAERVAAKALGGAGKVHEVAGKIRAKITSPDALAALKARIVTERAAISGIEGGLRRGQYKKLREGMLMLEGLYPKFFKK